MSASPSPGRHRRPGTVTTRPGVDTAAAGRPPAPGAPSSPEGRCLSNPGEPADRRVTGLQGQAGDAAVAAVEAQPAVECPALPRSRRRSLWLS